MNTLWTYGCSFTAEYYPLDSPEMKSNYDDYKKWKNGSINPVWPTLLSKKLNYNLENRAVGGASNYLILKQFLEFVHHIKENDILIFGWTQMARFELVNVDENKFNQILPSAYEWPGINVSQKSMNEIFINRTHPLWNEELVLWILFINLFINKIGAHVFHWTSDPDTCSHFKKWFKDDYRFINGLDFENLNRTIMGEICDLVKSKTGKDLASIYAETNGEVDDGHFGEYGHFEQSEYFYNHIKEYI